MLYGKLFEQMYDGTLGTRGPWQALVTFQQLIILADPDGIIDMTREAIARRTTIPLEIITVGIAALEEPDPQSRTPVAEGRRITRLDPDRDWGWHITNYELYKKLRSQDERRTYMRDYQRNRRKSDVNTSKQGSTAVSDVNPISMQYAVCSMEELNTFAQAWALYPKRTGGNSRQVAEKCWNARIREGIAAADLIAGITRYAAYCDAMGKTGTEYVKQAGTFLGPAQWWKESWDIPPKRDPGGIDWTKPIAE